MKNSSTAPNPEKIQQVAFPRDFLLGDLRSAIFFPIIRHVVEQRHLVRKRNFVSEE